MNKYKKALDNIVSTIIEEEADGYLEPRTAGDFCWESKNILQELVDKAESFEWIPFEREDGFILCQIKAEDGFLHRQIPNVGEKILVTDGKRVWKDRWIKYDDGYALDSNYDLDVVTAWMPLPKPYKEKEND